MFMPHANLSDEINRRIVDSEIEGGVFLKDLPPSSVLQIQTMHHCYTAVLLGGSNALISGHPEFCPQPVQVTIAGSTWGSSMMKLRFVGRGMHLEFHHPGYRTSIVTSPIQAIRVYAGPGSSETEIFLEFQLPEPAKRTVHSSQMEREGSIR